jgi:hypothetical protein
MATAIPMILMGAATIGGAIQKRNEGIIESHNLKAAARKEGDAAKQREIERKRTLLRTLSAQTASAGARGVTMGGSLGALSRVDIRDASNDLLVDRANTGTRINALNAGAKNARRSGNLGATVSLFDGAAKTYSLMPAPKKKAS